MEDITKEKSDGLKGLNTVEGSERELKQMGETVPQEDQRGEYYQSLKQINAAPFRSLVQHQRLEKQVGDKEPLIQGVGREGVGDSYYDKYIGSLTDLENLDAIRGENQGWGMQIFNGAAKAGILAATTFIDGTVGTLFGLGNWIATGEFRGLWDNPISQALQDVNDWSESALPNYRSMQQQEADWWDPANMFSANFLGDNIIKNLGFTIGAAYSGKLWNAGLMKGLKAASKIPGLSKLDLTNAKDAYKGTILAAGDGKNMAKESLLKGKSPLEAKKIIDELASDAKRLKTAGVLQQWNGALFGALGEGRSEAIRGVREFNEDKLFNIENNESKALNQAALDLAENDPNVLIETLDEYGNTKVQINPEKMEAVKDYSKKYYDSDKEREALKHINTSMGNLIYMANIGVLTLSDAYAFGSFFAGGYKTGRSVRGIKAINRQGVKEFAKDLSVARTIRKLSSKAFMEGPYEEMGQNFVTEVGTALAEQDLQKFHEGKYDPEASRSMNDYLNALNEGLKNSYLDVDTWEEGFSGAISGMMGIPKLRSARKNGKFRSPISADGGIFEDIADILHDRKTAKDAVNQLNGILQGDDFLNYYQGLIRSSNFQKLMDTALKEGDEFEFKNHQLSKLISDVNTFSRAGKIQDFYDIIEGMANITGDQVAEIREFVDNKEDGTNIFADKSDEQVIAHIKKQAKYIKEGADKYSSVLEDLHVKYGDTYVSETLEEMAFYTVHADNLQKRYDTLAEETKASVMKNMKDYGRYSEEKLYFDKDKDGKIAKHPLTKDSEYITIEELLNSSPGDLITYIGLSEDVADLVFGIDPRNPENKTTELSENTIKFIDLTRIANTRAKYINLLDRAIADPNALEEEINKKKEEAKKTSDKSEMLVIKDTINNIDSLQDLLEYIGEFNEGSDAHNDLLDALEELEKEGNSLVKLYKNRKSYNTNLKANLRKNTDEESYSHASYLWDLHMNRAESMDELSNPESDVLNDMSLLNNPEASPEDNNYNFLKAQYNVQKAMNALNNSRKFADIIKDEYKEFKNKNKSKLDAAEKKRATRTGKDGVATVDPVNTNKVAKPISHPEIVSENELFDILEKANQERYNKNFIDYLKKQGVKIHVNLLRDNNAINRMREIISDSTLTKEDKLDAIFGKNLKVENTDNNRVADPDANRNAEEISNSVRKENKELKDETPTESSFGNTKDHVRAAIPEFEIEGVKKGEFIPYNQAKKEQGFNYDTIYDYLKESGAFEYVDLGKLKEGDQIGFKIDPVLQSKMDPKFPPVILIYKVSDGQILGSLHSGKIAESYAGLQGLRETIESEYAEFKKDKPNEVYTSELTTSVSQVLNGVIEYTEEMNNLKGMEGVENQEDEVVFGIIKNGKLVTGKKKVPFTGMKSTKNKEGRFYLLVKNAKGEYQPVSVRRKRFNSTEFDNSNAEVQDSDLYKKIQEAVTNLAKAETNADILHILNNELSHLLYTQNLKLDLVEGKHGGYSLSIRHLELDERGNEVRKKKKNEDGTYSDSPVYSYKEFVPYFTKEGDGFVGRKVEDIASDIISKLYELNLPFQINLNDLNEGNYNKKLIDSGILETNIAKAKVNNSFFIADYFNAELELQKASKLKNNYKENRRNSSTSVSGKESAIPGNKIVVGNQTVYVDTTRDKVYDFNGKEITKGKEKFIDVATAQELYGDVENSDKVYNRKAKLRNGKIVNLDTNKYVTGKEANEVNKALLKRKKESSLGNPKNKATKTIQARKAKAAKIVDQINSDQQRVLKDKTDSRYYYIIEADGKTYAYDRVHTKLGSNWITTEQEQAQIDELEAFVEANLNDENIALIADKARQLGVDLDVITLPMMKKDKDKVKAIFRDAVLKVNSFRALEAGTAVDEVVRAFFMGEKLTKPEILSTKAYNTLIERLQELQKQLDDSGSKFLTNNLVLFHKDSNGNRVAGEVDILVVDGEGNFHIYDIKTSSRSFYSKDSFFNKKGKRSLMSSKDYYTLQLSAYKNLFESMYGTPVVNLGIIPFVLSYKGNTVEGMTYESYIPIDYNKAVNVANESGISQGEVYTPTATSTHPIFANTDLGVTVEDKSNEPKLHKDDQVGVVPYFHKDSNGKEQKTYVKVPLHKVYEVNGKPIYAAKIPVYNSDDFNSGEGIVVKMFDLILVTANGENITKNPFRVKSNIQAADVVSLAETTLNKVDINTLESVFLRENEFTAAVKALEEANKKAKEATVEKTKPQNKKEGTQEGNFENLDGIEDADVEGDDSFDIVFGDDSPVETKLTNDHVDTLDAKARDVKTVHKKQNRFKNRKKRLSAVTDESKTGTIRIQEELDWLGRVLPFMSEEGLVEIHKGLINATSQDAEAWGMFKDGMITISDMAASGTIYHEAFHVVFNSLLSKGEIELLYAEAAKKWGKLSPIQLEEKMAEEFKEYTLTRDDQGIGKKLIQFFKSLFQKLMFWKDIHTNLDSLYRKINDGGFANTTLETYTLGLETNAKNDLKPYKLQERLDHIKSLPRVKEEVNLEGMSNLEKDLYKLKENPIFKELSSETKNNINNFGITEEQFNRMSLDEKETAIKCL